MLFGFGLLGLVAIGVWLFAVFDVVTARADQVRNLQKVLWVLIVLFGVEVGAVCYLFYGRPRPVMAGTARPGAGTGRRPAGRASAPDDDVEFLRSLNPKRGEDGPLL